ncbi:MAG: hypothetical protein GY838_01215 [bacterium]|nr:hypothetical protein [bacterium]
MFSAKVFARIRRVNTCFDTAIPSVISAGGTTRAGLHSPAGALPIFLQLLAMSTFAFAQPLLDIVRRHPQFLVVNRTDWTALVGAAAGWWAFRRLSPVRENLVLLALTVPVFVGLFVFSDSVRTAVGPAEWAGHGVGSTTESVPVVLVILDELPLATLLDSTSDIDERLFPNFNRLAAQATWYPRTASVSGATLRAVPSILTGRLSDWDQPPNLGGHPENLFTVLGPTHRILAAEAQTALCTAEYTSQPYSDSAGRFSHLLDDVSILMRHVLYPREFRAGLPPSATSGTISRGTTDRSGATSATASFEHSSTVSNVRTSRSWP